MEEAAAIDIQPHFLGISGVAAFALILICGLVVEVIATLGITGYLQKVRPELLIEEMDA